MPIASHESLKELAKQILIAKGFTEDQIFQEYPIAISGAKANVTYTIDGIKIKPPGPEIIIKKGLICDVIGINEQHSVAIECGTTPGDRIAQLTMFFDEVILLPYGMETSKELKDIQNLHRQIEYRDKQIKELLEDNMRYKIVIDGVRKQTENV